MLFRAPFAFERPRILPKTLPLSPFCHLFVLVSLKCHFFVPVGTVFTRKCHFLVEKMTLLAILFTRKVRQERATVVATNFVAQILASLILVHAHPCTPSCCLMS